METVILNRQLLEEDVKKPTSTTATSFVFENITNFRKLSVEQARVVQHVAHGNHCTVQAPPGSGKSELIAVLVEAFPEKKFIIVCYNTKLAASTRAKIRRQVKNRDFDKHPVLVKTFHGLLSSMVGTSVHNDIMMAEYLESTDFSEMKETWRFADFDFMICDENQDMRLVMFKLIARTIILSSLRAWDVRMILLGDKDQSLYGFFAINKADSRFLTHAEEIFEPFVNVQRKIQEAKQEAADDVNSDTATEIDEKQPVLVKPQWFHSYLPLSYRITPQMARVTNALIGATGNRCIESAKPARLTNWVTMYFLDIYRSAADTILEIIQRETNGRKDRYGDFIVLFRSLNNRSPAVRIVDVLAANNIPVYVARSGSLGQNAAPTGGGGGEGGLASATTHNKVRLLTDLGGKGLQAKFVIMVTLEPLLEPELITKAQFVSLTRAEERLYILANSGSASQSQLSDLIKNRGLKQSDLRIVILDSLPLVFRPPRKRKQQIATEVQDVKPLAVKQQLGSTNKKAIDACDLFSYMDPDHIKQLKRHIQSTMLQPPINTEDVEQLVLPNASNDDDNADSDMKMSNTEPIQKSEIMFDENGNEIDLTIMLDDEDCIEITEQELYLRELTLSFDGGHTSFNLAHIVSASIELALEYALARRIPQKARSVFDTTVTKNDARSCKITSLFETAMLLIDHLDAHFPTKIIVATENDSRDNETKNGDLAGLAPNIHHYNDVCDFMTKTGIMEAFVRMALACDAFHAYSEYVYAVQDFSFIRTPRVNTRFSSLYCGLAFLFETSSINSSKLQWNVEESRTITHDKFVERIRVCHSILDTDRSLTVMFAHGPSTTDENRLQAVVHNVLVPPQSSPVYHLSSSKSNINTNVHVSTTVLQNNHVAAVSHAYIANVLDGSLELVDLSYLESKHDNSLLTDEKILAQKHSFLSMVLSHKLWNQLDDKEQDDDRLLAIQQDMKATSSLDTAEFVSRCQEEIRSIIAESNMHIFLD